MDKLSFEPTEFVESLYHALLGREADPGGLSEKVARLTSGGVTPGQLIFECLYAEEFAAHLPEFMHRFGIGERRGLFNDVTQHGELQLFLRHWLQETAVGCFVVDVGARGRDRSNSYDLCRWFGWRGILVEANPALLATIAEEFDGLAVEVASCAISDYNGRAELTIGMNDDVSSLEPHMAQAWGETRGSVEVEVRRLPDFLDERGAPERFDLLSLDIEGQDVRVLNDLVMDGRFKPTWVFLEASFDFATTRLEDVGANAAVLRDYALVGATRANLLLKRR